MLRSFDYAARMPLVSGQPDAQHLYRATEWAERNRASFCAGYAEAAANDPRHTSALLRAFELDKAVYEVLYEYAHRPAWVLVPMHAITTLTTSGATP
jgi:maltokinase